MSTRRRAAASSSASGALSRAVQIAVMSAVFWSVSSKSGFTARARSTSRSVAAAGSSGPSARLCSPPTRSRIRLVASTETAEARRRPASSGAASTTCSTLSSSRSMRRSAERRDEVLADRSRSVVDDAERPRDRRGHEAGVEHGREVDEDHAVGERGLDLARRRDRETALADAARTGQRDQPALLDGQHPDDRRELRITAEQGGERRRQCDQRPAWSVERRRLRHRRSPRDAGRRRRTARPARSRGRR